MDTGTAEVDHFSRIYNLNSCNVDNKTRDN